MTKDQYKEDVWSMPDWAPRDTGDILIRDGNWVLSQEDVTETDAWTASPGRMWEYRPKGAPLNTWISHYCHGEQWKIRLASTQILCSACREAVPKELIGLKEMVDWDK